MLAEIELESEAVVWATAAVTGYTSVDKVLAEMAALACRRRDGRWIVQCRRSRFLRTAGGDERDLSWTMWAIGEFRLAASVEGPDGIETWTLHVGADPDVANFLGYELPLPPSAPSRARTGPARPRVHPSTLRRVRLAVYERDGFRCRVCGWSPPVPEGYDGRHALAADDDRPGHRPCAVRILELDHIHPFKLGGRFEVTNLQALCNTCNARKGARV